MVSDLTVGAKVGQTQFPGLNGITHFFDQFLEDHKAVKGKLNILKLIQYLGMSKKYIPGYLKNSIQPITSKYQDHELESLNPESKNKIRPSS